MAMSRADMDKRAAQGCAMGCRHDHPHPLYLHAPCHPEAPISMDYDPERRILSGFCAICYRPVGQFRLASAPDSPLHCTTCPDLGPTEVFVWPEYTQGTGVLVLSCYWCRGVTARLPMAEFGLQSAGVPLR